MSKSDKNGIHALDDVENKQSLAEIDIMELAKRTTDQIFIWLDLSDDDERLTDLVCAQEI